MGELPYFFVLRRHLPSLNLVKVVVSSLVKVVVSSLVKVARVCHAMTPTNNLVPSFLNCVFSVWMASQGKTMHHVMSEGGVMYSLP